MGFVIDRFFIKLLKTDSMHAARPCQQFFIV